MTNKNDISNISYTNKDFQTIYPELLDLVKKLTNKWDPSLSNESDPGVLLLKLNAIIADKNNYNIDKNILECFPTSVTQQGNARRIYDSLGYKMHWYRSAVTRIGFQLKNNKYIQDVATVIPEFKMFTDQTSEQVYTITNKVDLYIDPVSMKSVYYVDAIEGRINSLKVNEKEDLTINNLDADLRLYFNESNIAENGIFIKRNIDQHWNQWTRVDNLKSESLNSFVYEFGVLPNSNTCYIQFPEDIMNLIGESNSFKVKYILSNGSKGNIKANVLTNFLDDHKVRYIDSDGQESEKIINDQIRILQPNAAINGEDPESISEAYSNYKNTVGTFKTLITRRDYENYLKNLKVSSGIKSLVPNCVVADRTNDLNSTINVQTWVPDTNIEEVFIKKCNVSGSNTNAPVLNAYNIVLYTLDQGDGTYDSLFKPTQKDEIKYKLEEKLDTEKCIQHNYLSVSNFASVLDKYYYLYKNLYALKGQVVTYSKITKLEAKELEENIILALERNYSSDKVNFGEEPNYNNLIDIIQNADTRIKSVILDIPKYQIYNISNNKVSGDSAIEIKEPDTNEKLDIVAKMILAGKVQLFKFDDEFDYEFGQKDIEALINKPIQAEPNTKKQFIKSLSTEVNINLQANREYEVKPNQTIQLYAPNFTTTKSYSNYVEYKFIANNKETVIPASTDYLLKENEVLKLKYKTSDGQTQIDKYGLNTIINSSISITANQTIVEDDDENYEGFNVLKTNQVIDIKELNKDEIPKNTKCYFILNNPENTLTLEEGKDLVLQEGESFIYTNPNTDELIVYQSGMQLNLGTEDIEWLPTNEEGKKIFTKVLGQGKDLDKLESEDWFELPCSIIATELDIITLGQGAKITCASNANLSNTPIPLPGQVEIISNDNSVIDIYTYPTEEGSKPYKILSKLSLTTSLTKGQVLSDNDKVILTYQTEKEDGSIGEYNEVVTNKTIIFNKPVILGGGQNIDATVMTEKGLENTLAAYSYTIDQVNSYIRENNIIKIAATDAVNGAKTLSFDFNFNTNENDVMWLIPFYINNADKTFKVNATISKGTGSVDLKDYQTNSTVFTNTGSYILAIPYESGVTKYSNLTFHITSGGSNSQNTIQIGKINKVLGFNNEEIDVKNDPNKNYNDYSNKDLFTVNNSLIQRIKDILNNEVLNVTSPNKDTKFNFVYRVPDSNKVLQPTASSSYWNINHIINNYTIPQIDFKNSSIKVNSYSISS